jgi:hypothetical protein
MKKTNPAPTRKNTAKKAKRPQAAQSGVLKVDNAKRVKELERENLQLKRTIDEMWLWKSLQ